MNKRFGIHIRATSNPWRFRTCSLTALRLAADPLGTGIFFELLQNADDAKANEVALLLDERSHGTTGLLSDGHAQYQGAALYAFNDARFSERDFASITSIGSSGKARDTATIGRFGLGFNTCFHLTDLPQFVSADSLCVFDPHGRSLPGGLVGARCRLSDAAADAPGALAPFASALAALGAPELASPRRARALSLAATLFRFPLRTEVQAVHSQISARAHAAESVLSSLRSLAAAAPQLLLFLQHVRRIRILHRAAAADAEVSLLCDVELQLPMPQGRHLLCSFAEQARAAQQMAAADADHAADADDADDADATAPAEPKPLFATFELLVADRLRGERRTWVVSAAVEAAPAYLAEAAETEPLRWAAVAAPVPAPAEAPSVALAGTEPLAGSLHCFLPLPAPSGLPVHVHASLALTTARTPVSVDGAAAAGRRGAAQAEWNLQLMEGVAARCYACVLVALAERGAPYDAWPAVSPEPPAPCGAMARAALRHLAEQGRRVLRDATSCKLLTLSEALLTDAEAAGGGDESLGSLTPPLASLLRRCRACVCAAPRRVARALRWADVPVRSLTPKEVAEQLRRHPAVTPTYEEALATLRHLLGGTGAAEEAQAEGWRLAVGLRLAPLIDGSVAKLEKTAGAPIHLADAALAAVLLPSAGARIIDLAAPEAALFGTAACRTQTSCRVLSLRALATLLPLHGGMPAAWKDVAAIARSADGTAHPAGLGMQTAATAHNPPEKKGGGRRRRGAHRAAPEPLPAPRADGSTLPAAELPALLARVARLWEHAESMDALAYAKDDVSALSALPIVALEVPEPVAPQAETEETEVLLSMREARARCMLSPDLLPHERATLSEFGCCFLATAAGPRQRAAVGTPAAGVCKALQLAQARGDGDGGGDGWRLRSILTRLRAGCAAGWDGDALRGLPIFESLSGCLDPLRPLLPILPPAIAATTAAEAVSHKGRASRARESDGEAAVMAAPDERWDALLLRCGLGDRFLAVGGCAHLWHSELGVTPPPRPRLAPFLGERLAPLLLELGDAAPAELCLAFLAAAGSHRGEASHWRSSPSKADLAVTRLVESGGLVVLDGGTRTNPSALADPSDRVLARLLPPELHMLPPPRYAADEHAMWAMRKAGMKTLASFDVCLAAARAVAQRAEELGGNAADELGSDAALLDDAEQLLATLCCEAGGGGGGGGALASVKELRFASSEWLALSHLAIAPALDCRQLEAPAATWDEARRRGASVTLAPPSSCCLWAEREKCWRQVLLLPAVLDKAPPARCSRLRIAPPPLWTVTANLASFARVAARRHGAAALPEPLRALAVRVAQATVGGLASALKSSAHAHREEIAGAADELRQLAWVPAEDGALVLPRHVSFETLEDDPLGARYDRRAPEWLRPHRAQFEALFGSVGLCSKAPPCSLAPPRPRVRGEPSAPSAIGAFAADQLFRPELADVVLVPPAPEPPLAPPLYAHRLALAAASPYFLRLLSGGFAEAASGSARLALELPAGVPPSAARRAVAYLYLGDAEAAHAGGALDAGGATDAGVAELCGLLRLADVWALEHLKSVCEVKLAAVVEAVADVTALLSHAQACNAQQLLAFCVHHCRVNLALCERTAGWAALGDDLKALVMRRS